LCAEALVVLRAAVGRGVEIAVNDVDTKEEWREVYGLLVPVTVFPGGEEMHYRVDAAAVRRLLGIIV
jgi:hypothetical protein